MPWRVRVADEERRDGEVDFVGQVGGASGRRSASPPRAPGQGDEPGAYLRR